MSDDRNRGRPPSSYGSMKSEDEEFEADEAGPSALPTLTSSIAMPGVTMLQMVHSEYPETLFTETTQQTKPMGACVIDTESFDELDDFEIEETDDIIVADSPEPPPAVEIEEYLREEEPDSQPGRIHPEQNMPHVFRSMQSVLSELTKEELCDFKMSLCQNKSKFTLPQVLPCDTLDLVDLMIQILGYDFALKSALNVLESIHKSDEAGELEKMCKKVLIRFELKQDIIRRHGVLYEGIAQAGRQQMLETVYVDPNVSTCSYGGVDPFHEVRTHPPSPHRLPTPDTFVKATNLFRLRRGDGSLVKTVVTTGIPGMGMSVLAGKFSLDWGEDRANRDFQYVLWLAFHGLNRLRKNKNDDTEMSIMEMIGHQVCREIKHLDYLEDPDCRFLIIMDSFDCYQTTLDWENAPELRDNHTPAKQEVLIVNLIRGNLLPYARIWILGRRPAVSTIPPHLIDVFTEIQGFSDEMKDDYLMRRFTDKHLAGRIVAHYKRTPSLKMLCRQPFICWMVATLFSRSLLDPDYGQDPPKLTPFYLHIMLVQTNRKLFRYYGQQENQLRWSDDDRQMLLKMGKMALKMVEKSTCVFHEEDLKEHGLGFREVTVFSGLCTDFPTEGANGKRKFCFIHLNVQEFMAAIYIFLMYFMNGKNVLESSPLHFSLNFSMTFTETRSAVDLYRTAVKRCLHSPPGQFDMLVRFLCGLLCKDIHRQMLGSMLVRSRDLQVGGLEDVAKNLQKAIGKAPPDRQGNLVECFRELTQKDD